NTTPGMPNRIKKTKPLATPTPLPPGDARLATMTQIPVTIAPLLTRTNVDLVAMGNSADNGVFKINGYDGVWVERLTLQGRTNYIIGLPGEAQTRPTADGKGGNAGNLKLRVEVGQENKESAGFSVAAIPMNWSAKLHHKIETGDYRGIEVA